MMNAVAVGIEKLSKKSGEQAVGIEKLSKKFGDQTVLSDVTHAFSAGRVHGIIGNNGSGKTVLFKCICGFLLPTEGRITLYGRQVGRDMDFPDNVGIIIEAPGFLPGLSGFQNLKVLASVRRRITDAQIKEAITRVGLDPEDRKKVAGYSLGMRQRLGIAQAVMEDPQLLILDEPFNGLDKHGVADMHEVVKELRERGKTILLASHNQSDIDALCDTVCEMDAGILTQVR